MFVNMSSSIRRMSLKKLFAVISLVLMPVCSLAQQAPPRPIQECASQVPWGWPQIQLPSGTGICRQAYVLLHDNEARIPAWVAYTLSPSHALGCVTRSNAFAADASLPDNARSEPKDFVGTGYDIGHQAPNGDMSWDPKVERESFILSNMIPQAPSFNRGIWKLLETSIRSWATDLGHTYTIYVGPIYNSADRRIGANRVVVPHGFYKIVVSNTTHQYAGWAFPHQSPYPNLGKDLTKFRASVASIQTLTGIQFALPSGGTELGVGQEWPVNYGKLTLSKRSVCGVAAPQD